MPSLRRHGNVKSVATTQAQTWDGAENGEFVPCNRPLQKNLSG
jgi:hypothetical protein